MSAPPRPARLWALVISMGCLGLALLGACAALTLLTASNLGRAAGEASPPPTPTAAAVAGTDVTAGPSLAGQERLPLYDDFDQLALSFFEADEDEQLRFSFIEGGYQIELKQPNLLVWALLEQEFGDIMVECDTLTPDGFGLSAAGLVFHYQDAANFYLFQVSNDGYYALDLLADDEWVSLIDWTPSGAIDDRANRLRVELHGDMIGLFVNDRQLELTRDDTFSGGDVGLAASSFDEPSAAMRFDNLAIRPHR